MENLIHTPYNIYCVKCLSPLSKIHNIVKQGAKDIININFECTKCGNISGDVIHQKDIRDHKLNKLID